MNLVQVSNFFNAISSQHPEINNYRFCWRSEANTNVQNNYDPEGHVGKLYPAVMFSADLSSQPEISKKSSVEVFRIELFFDDLLYYGNDSGYKNNTLIETWALLNKIAKSFLIEIKENGKGFGMVINSKPVFDYDQGLNDRVATIKVTFELQVPSDCVYLDLDLSEGSVPYPPEEVDFEKQTNPV